MASSLSLRMVRASATSSGSQAPARMSSLRSPSSVTTTMRASFLLRPRNPGVPQQRFGGPALDNARRVGVARLVDHQVGRDRVLGGEDVRALRSGCTLGRPRTTLTTSAFTTHSDERDHTIGRLRGCLQTLLPAMPIVPQPYQQRFISRVTLQRCEALVRREPGI